MRLQIRPAICSHGLHKCPTVARALPCSCTTSRPTGAAPAVWLLPHGGHAADLEQWRSCLLVAAGVLLSRAELERASELCVSAGAWLIVDNTYEHFTYDGEQHECVHGPHVINVFSFSKVGRHTVEALPSPAAAALRLFQSIQLDCGSWWLVWGVS